MGWGELSDLAGVYTLGMSEGTIVNNNNIHDVYSYAYGGWGLYTDEGSTGITLSNNLVYNCKSAGFHQNYGKDNIVKNNIFAFNQVSQLQATRVESTNSFTFTNNIIYFNNGTLTGTTQYGPNWTYVKMISNYNCYWDTRTTNVRFGNMSFAQWKGTGKDVNSVIANPNFVNPSAYDFRFSNQSVANSIGFVPFDYSQSGVYGSPEWIQKAKLNQQIIDAFNQNVQQRIANNEYPL